MANVVLAAAPITVEESQSLDARMKRAMRPKPPKILRPRLTLDFAVLLMRSSYNVLDELDCVAMDQFQRDFFLIRQAEYEPYVHQLGVGFVQQGDLTNPYYFDFISFAQYTTISREMVQNPPFVFVEKQPVEVPEGEPQKFVDVLIRRDPSITNDLLPVEHSKRVGVRILNRLEELFDDTPSAIPKFSSSSSSRRRPNSEELLASLQQLVSLFVLNGYAFDGRATQIEATKPNQLQFSLTLTSPATLWGGQALLRERAAVTNDFLLHTSNALVEKNGFKTVGFATKYDAPNQVSYITVI
ncbi:hypothetical protein ACA910_006266 [Epithemia clementina (nom. ined.)]